MSGMKLKGTIRRSDLEGGHWVLETDSGDRYQLTGALGHHAANVISEPQAGLHSHAPRAGNPSSGSSSSGSGGGGDRGGRRRRRRGGRGRSGANADA